MVLEKDGKVATGKGGVEIVSALDRVRALGPLTDYGVVVLHASTAVDELACDIRGGGFPVIHDVALVAHTQQQDLGIVQ